MKRIAFLVASALAVVAAVVGMYAASLTGASPAPSAVAQSPPRESAGAEHGGAG